MTSQTFESTYPKYAFAPLVELALKLARLIKNWTPQAHDHNSADGIHGLSA